MIFNSHCLRAPGALLIALGTLSSPAIRAEGASEADPVQEIIISTGTRETNRIAAASLAPVDVISSAELSRAGQTDLRDALATLAPSITRQALSGDTANLTDVLALRGLSPDHVLVLVNGKRRHTTANIYLDGSAQQGSTGVDIDMLPISLIDHVEILRDGASAQYGSDAIAGVINIILRSDTDGGELENTSGLTYEGDGFRQHDSARAALSLADRGHLDLSAEFAHQSHTVRSGIDLLSGQYDNPIQGDPSSTRVALGLSSKYAVTDDVDVYGFATYAHRDGASYQNHRGPTTLPAVYPDGFTPQETLGENDYSITGGAKGRNLYGASWDLSATYGSDHDDLGMKDSANAALFADTGSTPTRFHLATLQNRESTVNLDLSRLFAVGSLAAPLSAALGFEHRKERYSVAAGDAASSYASGSAALPGLSPLSASDNSRNVSGAYLDLVAPLVSDLQVDLAGRFEHYSDVGNTLDGKVSARYDITPQFAVRAGVSTGFRAPSLAEEHFTNVNVTPLSANGLLAANSAAARAIGAAPLRAERSTDLTMGVVLRPIHDLTIAMDAYRIDIRNRIVAGGTYSGQAAIDALSLAGFQLPVDINPAYVTTNYFTNEARTWTTGLDLTGAYQADLGRWGRTVWDLGLNLNTTSVDHSAKDLNGNPLLNAQQVAWLTTTTPRNRISLGTVWSVNSWDVSLHETRFGQTSAEQYYTSGPNMFSTTVFSHFINTPKYVTDLELRYTVSQQLRIAVGANNLFNVYPSRLPLNNQLLGLLYDPYAAQIGSNGGFYYLRANYFL